MRIRVQDALRRRLEKFGLTLEPDKTKLVEFGRFAQRQAGKRGRKRPETIYFLGMTLYCTRNLKGNFKVGMRTEKSRLRRSLTSLQELMRQIRHLTISDQARRNQRHPARPLCLLRHRRETFGHCSRFTEPWSATGARCCAAAAGTASASPGSIFNKIKERTPLLRPKLRLPYREAAGPRSAVNHLPKSVVREIRTPRSVGTGGGRPPPVTRWMWKRSHGSTPLRHRQTKAAETDRPSLPPPRHISTLPGGEICGLSGMSGSPRKAALELRSHAVTAFAAVGSGKLDGPDERRARN